MEQVSSGGVNQDLICSLYAARGYSNCCVGGRYILGGEYGPGNQLVRTVLELGVPKPSDDPLHHLSGYRLDGRGEQKS